jgi:hypothetical protein
MWNPFRMRRAQKKWQAINSLTDWNVREFYYRKALYREREASLYDTPRGYFYGILSMPFPKVDHIATTLSQMLFVSNSRQGRALAQAKQLGRI